MSEITNQSVEQTQEPTSPSLQLSDLVLALQTIQAMAQRGAVRADEMSTLGPLHDRLFAFLESQGAISRQDPNAAPTTPAGETNA